MKDDLYFFPIIVKALRASDKKAAIKDAFVRIQEMGTQRRYRKGASQFGRFMESVQEQGRILFVVECNGDRVGTISVHPAGLMARLPGIRPGTYTISLSTGRLLWEGALTEADLLWSKAFPGRALSLAADTSGAEQPVTRREALLGNEVQLLVFPGVESGEMGIQIE